MDLTC